MSNVGTWFKNAKNTVVKNAPTILTWFSFGGLVSTGFLAARAGRKHQHIVENDPTIETPQEEFEKVWKCYIPPVVSGVATGAAMYGSLKMSENRAAAIAGLCASTQNALTAYQEKVEAEVGQAKNQEYIEAARVQQMQQLNTMDSDGRDLIYDTGKGKDIFCEESCGRLFYSSRAAVEEAVNLVNERLNSGVCVSLNTLYYYLGIPETGLGNIVGWRSGDGLVKIDWSYGPTQDGRSCSIIDFMRPPRVDYDF